MRKSRSKVIQRSSNIWQKTLLPIFGIYHKSVVAHMQCKLIYAKVGQRSSKGHQIFGKNFTLNLWYIPLGSSCPYAVQAKIRKSRSKVIQRSPKIWPNIFDPLLIHFPPTSLLYTVQWLRYLKVENYPQCRSKVIQRSPKIWPKIFGPLSIHFPPTSLLYTVQWLRYLKLENYPQCNIVASFIF